eukprot:SM000045S16170  [mRNA]  locus=s45:58613:62583:- [translate_table: standard]
MVAALKFFLTVDTADEEGSDDDDEGDDEGPSQKSAVALDRGDVYKAFHKGTTSSKKKKQAKLRRVMAGLKKQQRRVSKGAYNAPSFAALQLLQDPQGFAEKLFARLKACNERFESLLAASGLWKAAEKSFLTTATPPVKLMLMNVISRVIGTHKLILLNFYPFLQRYVQPHQRDVTHLLASLVQACHDLVPPENVEPVLRQLVNQFVHDRARPEVMAVGINTVREICMRMPLIMTQDLLRDLALYKKSKDKATNSAARSIIALFRELAPALLEKKDRGRGADTSVQPKAYGETDVATGIPGLELLQQNEGGSDDSSSKDNGSIELDDGQSDISAAILGSSGAVESDSEVGPRQGDDVDEDVIHDDATEADDAETSSVNSEDVLDMEDESDDSEGQAEYSEQDKDRRAMARERATQRLASAREAGSLEKEEPNPEDDNGFLSNEDFLQIRRLQAKKAMHDSLEKHGLHKTGSKKGEPMKPVLRELSSLHEKRMDPMELQVAVRSRKSKEERLASVMAGREGREKFGAKAALKEKKSGGLTNQEKQKRKQRAMPLAAQRQKLKQRLTSRKPGKRASLKAFKGKKAWKT